MKSRSEVVSTILRVLFGPVLFTAFVITLGATACTAGASATAEPSQTTVPTATVTATPAATATATASPTATSTVMSTNTPQLAALTLSDLTCTDFHPGVYNPDGPNRFLTLAATVTNTSDEAVQLKEATGGGGLAVAEYLGEDGSVVLSVEGSVETATLAAGESYQVDITQGDPEMGVAESCRLVLVGADGEPVSYSGDQSAEVERFFAP